MFLYLGSLGSLPRINELYQIPNEKSEVAWAGATETIQSSALPLNSFQLDLKSGVDQSDKHYAEELDGVVRYWSDYNSVYHHPRSMVQLQQFAYQDEGKTFSSFVQGEEAGMDQEWVMDKQVYI
jgi:hypothetical protein